MNFGLLELQIEFFLDYDCITFLSQTNTATLCQIAAAKQCVNLMYLASFSPCVNRQC